MLPAPPPTHPASLREGAAAVPAERRRESAPFCSVVMTCVLEPGDLQVHLVLRAQTQVPTTQNALRPEERTWETGVVPPATWPDTHGTRHSPGAQPGGPLSLDGARAEAPRGSPTWSLASSR